MLGRFFVASYYKLVSFLLIQQAICYLFSRLSYPVQHATLPCSAGYAKLSPASFGWAWKQRNFIIENRQLQGHQRSNCSTQILENVGDA